MGLDRIKLLAIDAYNGQGRIGTGHPETAGPYIVEGRVAPLYNLWPDQCFLNPQLKKLMLYIHL